MSCAMRRSLAHSVAHITLSSFDFAILVAQTKRPGPQIQLVRTVYRIRTCRQLRGSSKIGLLKL